jgi:asparagine synthase (glutamine-hydrolysing)
MPGIAGFTNPYEDQGQNKKLIDSMLRTMTYSDNYIIENNVIDRSVTMGRSEYVLLRTQSDTYSSDGVSVWMVGEFYDTSTDGIKSGTTYTKMICSHYRHNTLKSFLQSVNGSFCACIYDSVKKRVSLLADRFGSRYMYWSRMGNSLIWASEIKCLLNYPGFPIEIDRNGVEDFVFFGYMLNDRTLLRNVRLLDAASILTYDLNNGGIDIDKYYTFELQPKMLLYDKEKIAEELGDIFRKAVRIRCKADIPLTVLLSGGYDSRAILAAIPDNLSPIHTVTFGEEGNEEIPIAQKYAIMKKSIHKISILKPDERFTPRIEQVWWTDGHYSILHMHGSGSTERNKKGPAVVLHGAASEILGVRNAMYSLNNLEQYFRTEVAHPELPSRMKEELRDYILQYDLFHDFFVDNYTRKFNINGVRLGMAGGAHIRTPFIDNDIFDYARLIPFELKKDRIIYLEMLRMNFPDYYREDTQIIQKHISHSYSAKYALNKVIRQKHLRKLIRTIYRRSKKSEKKISSFIQNQATRQFIEDTLLQKNAYSKEIISMDRATDWYVKLLNNDNIYAESLGRLLTVEVWLKLIYEKKVEKHFYLN